MHCNSAVSTTSDSQLGGAGYIFEDLSNANGGERPFGRARRVLHVAQPVEAGVAVVVRHLVEHQVQQGWQVGVACPPEGSLPEWIREAGGIVLPWHARREPGPSVLREVVALRRLVNRFHPDLIHLHSSKAGLVGRLAVHRQIPTVYQPHAWSFLAVAGLIQTLSTYWERFATRWADAVSCVSEAEMAVGKTQGLRAHWYICQNGVDLQRFHPFAQSDTEAARIRLGLGNELLVICVGRLCEQKGQDTLLDAWSRLRADGDFVLALVGDGPTRGSLEALAGDGIVFAGSSTDVVSWYEAASLVVQPSRWEGASLVIREAMACGLSVVATDVPGVREALTEACGAVVPVDDAVTLADAIRRRLLDESLRRGEGSEGRRVAEEGLGHIATLRKTDHMYAEVLQSRAV